jgi:hypothetical protein
VIAIVGTLLAVATIVFVRRIERYLRLPDQLHERPLDELSVEE